MTFAAIAPGFAKRGHFDQALWMAQSIKDAEGKASALRNVASVYLESGRYAEALQTAVKIGQRHVQSRALVDIAVDCAESGHTPGPDETWVLREIVGDLR